MIDISYIRHRARAHSPIELQIGDNRHAAVAMILRTRRRQVEALFIERTRRSDDPWSGQMAFPGGMVEAVDANARRAAERETLEEVGLDLESSEYLGALDDQQGRHAGHPRGIIVSGYVYSHNDWSAVRTNHEVQEVVWVPLSRFLDPLWHTQVTHPVEPDRRFSGIRISDTDHQVVWGLTRRFLVSFFNICDIEFGDE